MKVYLASAGVPEKWSVIPLWRGFAAADRTGTHTLCDDPEEADVVLFTECHQLDWRLRGIRESPIRQRYGSKCFVYDERDRPWCALPGVYMSMPKSRFLAKYQRAWGYWTISTRPLSADPDLLFSFVASRSHPSRAALFDLSHPRAVVEEAPSGFVFYDKDSQDFALRKARFADVTGRSKFVLCPRGHGTSSIRLYETMAAGRVPVILSDDWMPPAGPDWGRFSIRWPENDVDGLVEHLERSEDQAPMMGSAAAAAFSEWFAEDVGFHNLVERLADLSRSVRPFPARGVRDRSFLTVGTRETYGDVRRFGVTKVRRGLELSRALRVGAFGPRGERSG